MRFIEGVEWGVYRAVVIGGSAGALDPLKAILSRMKNDFSLIILVVQHLHASDNGSFAEYLDGVVEVHVREPCDKEQLQPGVVYIAPANYHMLVEADYSISLTVDERVNWSRPSIDVLFESAAQIWGDATVAIILSGANHDGTEGMRSIKAAGGLTIVQDPDHADTPEMPRAAIQADIVDMVVSEADIAQILVELHERGQS